MQQNTKLAPYFKAQSKQCNHLSDWLVLVGEGAYYAYFDRKKQAGKGEQWQLIRDAYKFSTDRQPVILDSKSFAEIDRLLLAPTEQAFIKIFQVGEIPTLSEGNDLKTRILLNLSKHNPNVKTVEWLDAALQSENLTPYIERIRQGEAMAESVADVPKLKENDRTNEKARAFRNWIGLDLALQRGNRDIYAYDGKLWNKLDSDDLEEKAVAFFEEHQLGYSDNTIMRLINTLKAQLPRMADSSSDVIAFKNGVLNRYTLSFEPHNRSHWLTAYIPQDYDASATDTPIFDKWLEFVSDGDKSKAYNILASLYAIVTNRYNWQLFFQITGEGGSGKSIFADIATLLVGEKNTASGRLENFDDERKLAGFENKKLILCPEQTKYAGDGGGVKAVTGGDLMRVDPKHKAPFSTKIKAVVMIVNNEPCKWTERNGGVERRAVNFNFSKVVPKNERDPEFMDKITVEIGGIIKKLLNTFINPLDAKKALEEQLESDEALEIKMRSDPLSAFFKYFYTTEQADGMYIGNATMGSVKMRTHLYSAYLAYTRALNIAELGLNTFVSGMEQSLKQHKNRYKLIKKKTKIGVRTNIHFKDIDDFMSDVQG